MAAHGFDVRPLPTLQDGRVALDDAAFMLADDRPTYSTCTVVASRGVAQPLAMVAHRTELVDAAQDLGSLDCAVGADVTYARRASGSPGPAELGCWRFVLELERHVARLPAPD